MDLKSGVSARAQTGCRGGAARRRRPVSPRSVLDGDSITTTTTAADSSCSAGTAATVTASSSSSSYDDDDEPCTPPAPQERQPWKGVAEAWRLRTMRRLPSLAPTMSSTLRRFSIRSGAWPQWQNAAAATSPADGNPACALRPPIRTFSLSELKKATRNFSKGRRRRSPRRRHRLH
uniref:Uncharacterized protein n=1 Tax=Oryza punctata TaxID=4537 RepID=A0A0E0MHL6_ORYPU